MFTSCFKALYVSVCVYVWVFSMWCLLYSSPALLGLWGGTNNVDCQLLHTHNHAHTHTHQLLIWCVCDVANGSGVVAVWGHMLSLITTEQSALALINSTDMTIRNPPPKDNTVARENVAVFIKNTHTHTHTHTHQESTVARRGSSWEESHCFDEKSVYCHCSLGRNDAYCWSFDYEYCYRFIET